MKVITTVHKEGFDVYGQRFLDGLKLWPAHDFTMYAEGFDAPCNFKRNESLPRLEALKNQYRKYKPLNWRWDVLRFANKVYAAYDAFYNHKGLGVYVDCDCVTYQQIPEGYIESMLPDGFYVGLFKRTGMHSETGFWVIDCDHPNHKHFLDQWLDVYESGLFKELPEWHDCETMDLTIRRFEKSNLIQSISLSQGFEKDMHPMAKADLGRYIDHTKGNRKAAGFSPENEFRNAA